MAFSNSTAPRTPYFVSSEIPNAPPPGSAVELTSSTPVVFQPLTIRNTTFHNRIWVSPMGQYSSAPTGPEVGSLTPYHLVTLGHYALRGASLVFIEVTGVTPNGRTSPNDAGLWNDAQIEGIRKVADFIHSQGAKVGLQLGHAGRKSSHLASWRTNRDEGKGNVIADHANHGWPDNLAAPSAIPWKEGYPVPRELSVEEIKEIVEAFGAAAKRAVAAGVDVIEIHGAHGYLLSAFNSPISNQRTDAYGGSFENRIRISKEVVAAVRASIPDSLPLFYRISSTEWMENSEIAKTRGSWDVEQSIRFAKLLPEWGVDLVDVSSGGNSTAQVPRHVTYQVEIAGRVRRELREARINLLVGAVGRITESEQAHDLLEGGESALADAILVARQFMLEPEWVLRVAWTLGVDVHWSVQSDVTRWFGKKRFEKGYTTSR